jgi:transaldolase
MPMNPLLQLEQHGQSVWLDNLTRELMETGRLEKLIEEDGLSGITSNPAIFNKAMTKGTAYDGQFRALVEKGLPTGKIYEAMAVQDIQNAADHLRRAYDDSNGTDGFVSLEVSPHLARDTEGTIAEAARLWKEVSRPNVLIKIPGTKEGIPAIRRSLVDGINVNVTLLFSLEAYREVMEAHLQAMEARVEAGKPPSEVASVASFFLSRIDVKVDKRLDDMKAAGEHVEEATALRGTAAVASARLAYRMWKGTYAGPRWEKLEKAGARFQKPLWASTSTKDPVYSDVKYVEALIGPHTVNTMPDETVEAFRDHGRVADTVEDDLDGQEKVLERLEAIGISVKRVTDELVDEGIEKFNQPFDALLAALEEKRKSLAAGRA